MWNIIGKITVLLSDFNAITISEIQGLDDDVYLAPMNNSLSNSTLNMTHITKKVEQVTNLTRHQIKKTKKVAKTPIVRDDNR